VQGLIKIEENKLLSFTRTEDETTVKKVLPFAEGMLRSWLEIDRSS
jgi:hypothetical protein